MGCLNFNNLGVGSRIDGRIRYWLKKIRVTKLGKKYLEVKCPGVTFYIWKSLVGISTLGFAILTAAGLKHFIITINLSLRK
jgi:hypothetical protein